MAFLSINGEVSRKPNKRLSALKIRLPRAKPGEMRLPYGTEGYPFESDWVYMPRPFILRGLGFFYALMLIEK